MACTNQNQRQTSSIFADDAETDTLAENYDLYEIQESGELIVATLSGPDTYFEFRGRGFGLQHDLAESFARSIGVRLRVEVAHDTTELLTRLKNREVDLIAMKLDATKGTVSVKSHWLVSSQTPLLAESIDQWYSPARLEETKKSSSTPIKARRHARPVMLDAATGTISQYDALLQRHASSIGWDWRLLAAQCYQESAFDPQAVSWAGAQGLMQIMPATAATLGVDASDIFTPETNVEAGVKLLRLLNNTFSDISPQSARIPYMLAAYNGGANHVRDAMALARKHGRNDKVWREVEPFILKLSEPRYYNDPVVRSGYLRGSETQGYVEAILDRWAQYRGQARNASRASTPQPAKRSKNPTEVRRPAFFPDSL